MTTLLVLFNLKADADSDAYEQWAVSTDLPTVRSLRHCQGFDLYKSQFLLGTDAAPPYQYAELIQIDDLPEFRKETSSETMQQVAAQFRSFANNPVFMVMDSISS